MYPRLKLLHQLLAEDGSLWVTIDDNEAHYLKVMLDEIFGRENFLYDIAYERSGSSGLGQAGLLVTTSEHLFSYKKNKADFKEVLFSRPLEHKEMKRYKSILVNKGEKVLIDEFISKSNGLPVKLYKHSDYKTRNISLAKFEEKELEIVNEYIQNFDLIFRTTNPQKENEFQNDLISKMQKGAVQR
jgi:adenine-specific DNA-methyltransferase